MSESSISVNLLTADAHGLESLLAQSANIGKVLIEYGNSSTIDCFEKQEDTDTHTGLLDAGIGSRLDSASPTNRPKITASYRMLNASKGRTVYRELISCSNLQYETNETKSSFQ